MYEFINTNAMDGHDAWVMVLISSIACILGASVVFIDVIYPSSHCSSILERPSVIASSMALGSGVMLFSALYSLLPASRIRLQSDYALYFFYFIGILATLVITQFVHYMAPDAIHSHGTTEDEEHHHHHKQPRHRFSETSTTSSITVTSTPTIEQEEEHIFSKSPINTTMPSNKLNENKNEGTRLLMQWNNQVVEYGSRDHHHHHHHHPHSHSHHHHHHHSDEENKNDNDYFRIGIQTAIAICIHKFPEGLIMFISGQASKRLGLSICAAMSIHNFIEGFMIALPLYFATKSRVRAFFYAALLGGMSQPLGAGLGVLALDNVTQEQQDLLFGITFGVTSGMMSLIAIQSMLPQAIKADPKQHYVPLFFFVGILLVGLASLLKSV
ncbi:Zinc/iron permease [Circinella umbellata]|nr:Zinc/iron permease [Circinella umbellata]